MKKEQRKLVSNIVLGLILSTSLYTTAWAAPAATTLPTGNVNVSGSNTVANDPAHTAANPVMRITQDTTTVNAQINWNTFSIGSAATVNVVQNSSNQTLVNKVVTNSLSEIYGKMNASGNVVLVNPNGIILAKGSEINAGGFAAYASEGTKLTDPANRISEGNIVADGTINVGVGTAKALADKFGVTNFAVGLGAASGFGNANKIALVANGDVTVNADAKLTAVDTTTTTGSSTQGAEGFNMGGVSSSVTGTVYIRPDANDNDYGQVYLNGSKLFKANSVDVYYNANVKGTATTDDGVSYNKKDFANDAGKQWLDMNDNTTTITKTNATLNPDAGTVTYVTKDETATAAGTVKGYALVHNMAQLQDIDTTINGKTNADGKLDGQYALGKDLYAQKDTLGNDYSYVLKHNGTNENPIIFTTTDGTKVTAVSGKDSGIFSSATSKTLRNGAVLNYTSGNVVSTYGGVTYTYNGTKITDGSGNTYTVSTDENGYTASKNGVAITDINTIATIAGLTIARNEFQDQTDLTTYLGKDAATVAKEFAHMNISTWNDNKGFDPIGNDATPFTGTIFGIGGDVIHIGDGLSEVHTIYDLPINLPTTDNVGLVGVGSGATIDYVQEANTSITGHSNVGGMMGKALNGSTISDSANIGNGIKGVLDITADSGYVRTTSTDQVSNIGGLVGYLEGSSIVESANAATIIGQVDPVTNLNVKNVGGLAGTASGSTITRSVNQGNVFGEEKTGGIVGNALNTSIGSVSLNDPTETVYNNGRITGTKDTGGIAGYGSNIHMYGVYNTNEDSALSGNSQYIIDPTGNIIGRNPTFVMRKGNQYDADGHLTGYSTSLAGNGIYSDAALSGYGAVTGDTNTGGLVGELENTSTIDTAYNAGNITGKTDTGGLVGKLNTTTDATYTTNIKNAYNGDNNTVIREDLGTIPSKVKAIANVAFDPVQSGSTTPNNYSFNPGDANYYSFYTLDGSGNKTYYYFIPAGGKTEAGAGGVFVTYNSGTDSVTFVKTADLPAANARVYTNRVGYKDANINGTTNTGGLFGEMNSGVVTTTYDTGTVNKGVASSTAGALAGTKSGGTLSTSFFVNDTDKTTVITKPYSGQANAVGTGTADANVAGNTLAYWRNSDNIKALSNDGSFLGDAAAVDSATGYQKFTGTTTGSIPKTYYWTTKGDVYYYTDEAAKTGKTVVMTYNKTTGKYDGIDGKHYTLDETVTKAIKENADSQAGSATYIYTNVKFDPVGGGTSLTMSYVTHASNETTDNTWIEYPDETTPLLQHFMFANNIARHLTYDAKTHNFKTDDVNNVYGRADFTDGVSGKNVNIANQAQSADPDYQGESEYFYNSAAIWSPQHGYKINANVSVTIKAVSLDINVQGTRVYGDAGNTTGYYVVVPYKLPQYDANGFEKKDAEGNILYGDQQWAYYTVNDGSGSTPYTLMTAADWTYGGKDYRSSATTPRPEDLLALCNAKATYMATYNGVAGLEATQLNTAVQTVIKALQVNNIDPKATGAITYTSAGNGLKQIETNAKYAGTTKYPLGDQSLEVGTYNVAGVTYDVNTGMITNMDTANIGGIENNTNNYNVTYSGGLTVNKADLFYTYDGEKVYGDANGSGSNKYTLVGKDADSTISSVNGYLKSFDSAKLTVDTNKVITAGAGVTTNGLTGSGAFTMSGTVLPATGTNITDNGEQSITQGSSGNSYYQVMVDPTTGTLKTYKVTKFDNGTMSISAANTSAEAAAYINKNYNMVWKSDTTEAAAKARTTITSTGVAGAATVINSGDGTGYNAAGTAPTAQASSELITPAELQVTVAGTRQYGDLMAKDAYNTGATNVFNVTGAATTAASSGLKAGDTIASIVNAANMYTVIDGIEALAGSHPTNQINEATDVGTYNLIGNTVQTASNIDVAAKDATTMHFNILNDNNYNYILKNGAHTETITAETVTITTTGERVYGDANSTSTINTPTATGMETWDAAKWTTVIADGLKTNVQNRTVIDDHAGVYGTKDYTNNKYTTDPNKGALYYLDTQKNEVSTAFGKNYVIDYQDTYAIKKAPLTVTVTGERQYGSNMDANGAYTVTAGAVPSPDTLTNKIYNLDVAGVKNVNGDTASNVLDAAGVKTKLATVDNGAGNNTDTVGSHTNIGTYTKDTAVKFTVDNINTAPKETTTNSILTTAANNDYYVTENGTNTLKIVPKRITITTSGSKTYGTDNPAAADYTVDGSQIETWDQADKYTAHVDTWKGNIYNPAEKYTSRGKYGTVNGTVAYLRYGDAAGSYEANVKTDIGANYDVTFADSFIINGAPVTIYFEGNRVYGTNGNVTNTAFTEDGIDLSHDGALWTGNKATWQNQYADSTYAATHHGVYGTQGPAGNAYATGAVTLTAAQKTDIENVLSNYQVTFTDKLTINPKDLVLLTSGQRTYGDANSTIVYNDIADKNGALTTADSALLNSYQSNLKSAIGLDSAITERSHAGTYGTNGTTASPVLTYTNTQKDATSAQLNGDYNITYEDLFTINKRDLAVTQTGTKTYGTGAEHTTYDPITLTNITVWDKDAMTNGAHLTNTSDRTTVVGKYTNSLLTVDFAAQPVIANDYNITATTTLNVIPDTFTYTADHTSYWQYQPIPPQTGKVTNSYGEDVSDLVGYLHWPTTATGKVVGLFPIWGVGANDQTGNYYAVQALGNETALEVKPVPWDEHNKENNNLEGAWRSVRRPLLDIMYLDVKGNGFNSWTKYQLGENLVVTGKATINDQNI